jgi:ankyrin repeat protein
VHFLVENGGDVHCRNIYDWNLLTWLVVTTVWKIDVSFLVRKGADLHANDNEDWAPLHDWACRFSSTETVNLLVSSGVAQCRYEKQQ